MRAFLRGYFRPVHPRSLISPRVNEVNVPRFPEVNVPRFPRFTGFSGFLRPRVFFSRVLVL